MSSMTAATAPVSTPQKITRGFFGSIAPRSDNVPMTIDAASAPDTKKIATSMTTITVVTALSGMCSSMPNS